MTTVTQNSLANTIDGVISTVLDNIKVDQALAGVTVDRHDTRPVEQTRGARQESVITFKGPQGSVEWNIFVVNDFGCALTSNITINSKSTGLWKQTFGGEPQRGNHACTADTISPALAFALKAIQSTSEGTHTSSTQEPLRNLRIPPFSLSKY